MANYVLSPNKKLLIEETLKPPVRAIDGKSADILGSYCSFTEESSQITSDSPAAHKKNLIRYEVYSEPFIPMDLPYYSPMQMKLQFKHHICDKYWLDLAELKKQDLLQRSRSKTAAEIMLNHPESSNI